MWCSLTNNVCIMPDHAFLLVGRKLCSLIFTMQPLRRQNRNQTKVRIGVTFTIITVFISWASWDTCTENRLLNISRQDFRLDTRLERKGVDVLTDSLTQQTERYHHSSYDFTQHATMQQYIPKFSYLPHPALYTQNTINRIHGFSTSIALAYKPWKLSHHHSQS